MTQTSGELHAVDWTKHRLYVDEVGNSDLGASMDANHRYLSLTGVIVNLDYVLHVLAPGMEALKARHFVSHPDDPVSLHRKELVNKRPPFESLRDPQREQTFNEDLLRCLREWEYVVLTVVLDKLEHRERYVTWQADPYHYCLRVLLERYVLWLRRHNCVGDVMAVSRGKKEDSRLKASFRRIYEGGTEYLEAATFQQRLTSGELKLKKKDNNIAGLQLADLIAHPSFRTVLARAQNQTLPTTFGGRIGRLLEESKYDRSTSGRLDGWGRKLLP
ncbi:MAG: DUF3800 domain-containing protein [Chthonomonadales bacterium]|nr:DUF3800 domain-containing protein [Chthonomonadales bacterium]